MLRRILIIFAATFCVLPRAAHGQCDDPFDSTLCVYKLTPGEAAQFSATDGQVSPLWNDWAGRDSLVLEYAHSTDTWFDTAWDGTKKRDASVVVKACGTDTGLYLLMAAHDDEWRDGSEQGGGPPWMRSVSDRLVLYLDECSSQFISENPIVWLAQDRLGTVSLYTQELEIWMGGSGPPSELVWSYADWSVHSVWYYRTWTFSEMGLLGAWVEAHELDSACRALELFLPWVAPGSSVDAGLDPYDDLSSRLLGLAVGYYDDDSAGAGSLAWQGCDPGRPYADVCWGDLRLDEWFGRVVAPLPVQQTRPVPSAAAQRVRTDVVFYSLTGCLITDMDGWSGPAVRVGRTVDGGTLRRVWVGR